MKKFLSFSILFILAHHYSFSQTARVVGPAEKQLADSVCSSVNKHDLSKITTKAQAITLYTQCISEHADLLMAFTEERKVDMQDEAAMQKIGIDLAADLMKNQCVGVISLMKYMSGVKENGDNLNSSTSGVLKRIDNKGFNYIVLIDNGLEKSFLWLRQFKGSDNFNNGMGANVGKHVKITWQELEVYLPEAKGYYKVKEITEMSFL